MRSVILPLGLAIGAFGVAAVGALCSGCSGGSTPRDAGADADAAEASVDAADAAPLACDKTKPFDPPTLVAGVNGPSSQELRARLSSDELTMYLEIAGKNVPQSLIYQSTRTTKQAQFGAPNLTPKVNTGSMQGAPSITADGLTLFLWSGPSEIWATTRTTTSVDFAPPAYVPNINVLGNHATPYVRPDGSVLYFSGGTPKLHLYRSTFSNGAFTAPQQLTTLNSADDEFDAVTNESDLIIYFASNRADASAKGGMDIWVSERKSTSAPFPAPTNVAELNTTGWDAPTWLSDDGCTLYLIADRNGSKDVYVTTRPK